MKNTCDVSSPSLESVPGDKIVPKHKVKLGPRAAQLFVWPGTPVTLLLLATLIWMKEKSSPGCLKSAVMKVKAWLAGEEN